MKIASFVVFFSIVLAVYGLINFYIFVRGWQSIPQTPFQKVFYLAVFFVISLSFIAGRILERIIPSSVSNIIVWIGSFWVAAMLYFFLFILLLDIARLVNHWLPFFPDFVKADYAKAKATAAWVAIGLATIIIVMGYINAIHPKIRTLQLNIPKPAAGLKALNIAMVSDIHLGTIIGRSRLDNLVKEINGLNPDIILLAGDIVDEDLGPVIRENIGEALKNLKAPLGVYAITGNHEYIGGVEKACRYLSTHNVSVLRDSVLKIDGHFYLVGREDRSIGQFAGRKRKSLSELISGVDKNYPLILLDHQPFKLQEAVFHGVDLQISGHTHHGQLWPVSIAINIIYELGAGYMKRGETQFYVSTGFGTWGPPVRIGNRPEIVNFRLTFQ
ncbi:MAG: metallophosphoesterase [candidate division Zixibacteria bacterium]|nr:metallophosphoesterase [candidate division Zixibacteria bacterium]